MNTKVNKIIAEVMNYYEFWSRPLNLSEIKNLATQKISLSEIKNSNTYKKYHQQNQKEIESFLQKQSISIAKRKKLEQIARWIRLVPFVHGVFGSGSLALMNTKKSSDLDVFIITANNRIFTARFLLTGLLTLLGVRRSDHRQSNRICLNHFLTENSQPQDKNLYTARLYALFYPLIEKSALRQFQKKNKWIQDFLPRYPFSTPSGRVYARGNRRLEKILSGRFGNLIEWILKIYQTRKIKKNPSYNKKGSRIIISDNELAFHPRPQQEQVLGK